MTAIAWAIITAALLHIPIKENDKNQAYGGAIMVGISSAATVLCTVLELR